MPTRSIGIGGGLNLALPELGAGGDPVDGAAVPLERGLVALEVVDRLGLEGDVLQPVAVRSREHQRVVVMLVPPLEVHVVVVACHFAQPQHLRVVRSTELEIGGSNLNVSETEDGHAPILLTPTRRGKPAVPNIGTR
jgi:hypothetical protein